MKSPVQTVEDAEASSDEQNHCRSGLVCRGTNMLNNHYAAQGACQGVSFSITLNALPERCRDFSYTPVPHKTPEEHVSGSLRTHHPPLLQPTALQVPACLCFGRFPFAKQSCIEVASSRRSSGCLPTSPQPSWDLRRKAIGCTSSTPSPRFLLVIGSADRGIFKDRLSAR